MGFIFLNISGLLLLIFSMWQADTQQVPTARQQQAELTGAWQLVSGTTQFADVPKGATAVVLLEDGYFTVAYFNKADRKFIGTFGGTYAATNGKLTQTFEFNTLDSTTVGTTNSLSYTLQDGQLRVKDSKPGDHKQQMWSKVKDANKTSPLTGTWRITGRAGEDGTINPMKRGPRKTLKILSDNRFQWIAFNTETKQFSGTGGGTYTAENGKYTENIEFFSRDSNRVGASLDFNFEVKDGKWLHTGKSSTGKPVNEVWERE